MAKFNGPKNQFKLNKAYASVGDLTFGLATSTFDDPVSQPSTVETQGPNSEIGDTRLLVRYMHDVSKNFTVAFSIEDPDYDVPTSSYFKPKTSSLPDALLSYNIRKASSMCACQA